MGRCHAQIFTVQSYFPLEKEIFMTRPESNEIQTSKNGCNPDAGIRRLQAIAAAWKPDMTLHEAMAAAGQVSKPVDVPIYQPPKVEIRGESPPGII